jgi:hypothetical protein
MPNVTVYKVQLYNAATDTPLISQRMATIRGAEMMGGVILWDTAIEIDASQLEPGRNRRHVVSTPTWSHSRVREPCFKTDD